MDDNKKKGQKAHSDDKPSAGQDSRRDFVRKALTASGFIVAAGAINSGLVPKAYAQVTTTTTTTTTTVQPTTTGSPTTTGGPTTTAPPPQPPLRPFLSRPLVLWVSPDWQQVSPWQQLSPTRSATTRTKRNPSNACAEHPHRCPEL
ncbi:hypothetical protein [Halioglobus japonicus]|uniref:hypothetical protein n=1 Tax=Halioglobus japonicus TaxID=930805 RepID=UPI0009FBDCBF|nr:hypothetical protein [Halioglobus japonicus]